METPMNPVDKEIADSFARVAAKGKLPIDDPQNLLPVVMYHRDCLDGTAAAWVASQYMPAATYFLSRQYHEGLNKEQMMEMQDRDIYIVDWCPEVPEIEALLRVCHRLVIIDHHISSIQRVDAWLAEEADADGAEPPNNLVLSFARNDEWSGALGTAKWFNQYCCGMMHVDRNHDANEPLEDHWAVQAVSDRDLWQFKLPYSKAICEALFVDPGFNLDKWRRRHWNDPAMHAMAKTAGMFLLDKAASETKHVCEGCAHPMRDHTGKVRGYIVNGPAHMHSDIGNYLAKDVELVVVWFVDKEDNIKFRFNSLKDGPISVDCAILAAKLGGGGHKHSAGTVMKGTTVTAALIAVRAELPW